MFFFEDRTQLVCLICRQKLTQINKGHVRKHMTRAHKDSVDSMTLFAKNSLKEKYLSDMKKGQDQMQQFLGQRDLIKAIKRANIRNRYIQAPHLTQDTNGKVTTSQLDITNESQEVSPFTADDHKASINRRTRKHNSNKTETQKKH